MPFHGATIESEWEQDAPVGALLLIAQKKEDFFEKAEER